MKLIKEFVKNSLGFFDMKLYGIKGGLKIYIGLHNKIIGGSNIEIKE